MKANLKRVELSEEPGVCEHIMCDEGGTTKEGRKKLNSSRELRVRIPKHTFLTKKGVQEFSPSRDNC